MDPAQFPAQQNADEEQDGKSDPEGQGPSHRIRFLGMGALLPPTHHEKQGRAQARQNGRKCKDDEVFHAGDYPVNPPPRWRQWRFMLITFAALAGVLAGLGLARWQLSRAAEKEALHAAELAQQQLPVLAQPDLLALFREQGRLPLYRRVRLEGEWLDRFTDFLDNRQMNGRPGFFVLTPLALSGGQGTVLVQRGWVPRNFEHREQLPVVLTPAGKVALTARVANAPSHLLELGSADSAPGFSRIRQNLDLALYREQTGLSLLPGSMVQIDPGADGLARDWFEPGADTAKHYGYAFQWFGLSGLIASLYVWFQIVRRKKSPISA